MKFTTNRAFFINPIRGRFGKLKGYQITDGLNEVELGLDDYFTINTNQPLSVRLLHFRETGISEIERKENETNSQRNR